MSRVTRTKRQRRLFSMNQHSPSYAKSRPSSTVVLVRESSGAPEMLLVLRHAQSSFGDSYVFPGGVLEAADGSVEGTAGGLSDEEASAMLGLSHGGRAYYSGAVRELFEESGVLLARNAVGEWVDPEPLSTQREKLNDGSLSWTDFVRDNQLNLVFDALHYFSYWVTPRELPKRFSTRFFIAEIPAGQKATHCGGELTDSRWISATDAITENKAAKIEIPSPTVATLNQLSEFRSVQSMLDWASKQASAGITRCRPAVVTIEGQRRVVMPENPDYPDYPEQK